MITIQRFAFFWGVLLCSALSVGLDFRIASAADTDAALAESESSENTKLACVCDCVGARGVTLYMDVGRVHNKFHLPADPCPPSVTACRGYYVPSDGSAPRESSGTLRGCFQAWVPVN